MLYEEVRQLKREVARLEAEAELSSQDLESLNLELEAIQKTRQPVHYTSTNNDAIYEAVSAAQVCVRVSLLVT